MFVKMGEHQRKSLHFIFQISQQIITCTISNSVLNFLFQIKVIDENKFKKFYEETMKQLDRLENEYLPQVKLDGSDVSDTL